MSFAPGDTEPSIVPGGEVRRSPPPNTSANYSAQSHSSHAAAPPNQVAFNRRELNRILDLYGRMVATGEWRDYAIDFLRDRAVFSIFRRASEVPIYRIEKDPRLTRRQGAFSVISATGLILRRGHELDRVIQVLEKPLRVVASRA